MSTFLYGVPLQTNALCNILGARTNNRLLQPLNGRTIKLGSYGPDSN
jgi:hypothetical protein